MNDVLSPRERYEQDLASGVLLPDPAQASVIDELDDLCRRLTQRVMREESIWARARSKIEKAAPKTSGGVSSRNMRAGGACPR